MKNELMWEVSVDGVLHRAICKITLNKYEIWVDDADYTVVYRENARRMRKGLEHELLIGDKKCLFVVWDEKPDLVVDGTMLKSNKDYFQEKAKRRKRMLTATWVMFAFGLAVLVFAVVALCIGGWNNEKMGWRHCSLYVLAAIWIIVDATLERMRWKE